MARTVSDEANNSQGVNPQDKSQGASMSKSFKEFLNYDKQPVTEVKNLIKKFNFF